MVYLSRVIARSSLVCLSAKSWENRHMIFVVHRYRKRKGKYRCKKWISPITTRRLPAQSWHPWMTRGRGGGYSTWGWYFILDFQMNMLPSIQKKIDHFLMSKIFCFLIIYSQDFITNHQGLAPIGSNIFYLFNWEFNLQPKRWKASGLITEVDLSTLLEPSPDVKSIHQRSSESRGFSPGRPVSGDTSPHSN